MEQLIYIESEDKQEAAKSAKSFALEEVYSRAYINSLATELAMKYLALDNVSVSNIYNMHSIRKIHEEFDLADIMLPNVMIDVRMVYDEKVIFIPKSHFDYNLVPDVYMVFKMAPDTSYVEFLGFFEPKLINKNNQNGDYYFIEKEKLSNPADLKAYIEKADHNTTQSLSEEETDSAHKLGMDFIDNNITDDDKRSLINMLVKSADLRRDLTEFDNFEWISYNVVNDTDMPLPTEVSPEADTTLAQDSLDVKDEFSEFETDEINMAGQAENADTAVSAEEQMLESDNISEDMPSDIMSSEISDSLETPVDNTDIETEPEGPSSFGDLESGDFKSVAGVEPEKESPDAVNLDALDLGDVNGGINGEITDLLSEDSLDIPEAKPLDMSEFSLSDDINLNGIDDASDDFVDTTSTLDDLHEEQLENPIDTVRNEDLEFTDELTSLNETSVLENVSDDNLSQESSDAEISNSFEDLQETASQPTGSAIESISLEDFENSDIFGESDLSDGSLDLASLNDETPVADDILQDEPPVSEDSPLQTDETFVPDDILQDETSVSDDSLLQADETFVSDDMLQNEPPASDDILKPVDDVAEPVSDVISETTEMVAAKDDLVPNNVPEQPGIDDLFDMENKPFDNFDNLQAENEPVVYVNSSVISNNDGNVGEIPIDINMFHQEISNEDLDNINETYGQMMSSQKRGRKNNGMLLVFAVVIAALAGVLAFITINKIHMKNANSVEVVDDKISEEVPDELPSSVVPQAIPADAELPDISSEAPQIEAQEPAPANNTKKPQVANKPAQTSTPQKIQKIDVPYLEVKSMNWSVPKYISANQKFSSYINSVTKSIKTKLTTELLLVTEYAYTNEFRVDIHLTKDGGLKDAHISKSSGSKQIDEVVLQTVKQTFNVMKAPSDIIVGDDLHLVLKIFI